MRANEVGAYDMTDYPDLSREVSSGLRKILNTHGYGFQYAILSEAKRLFDERRSGWRFEAAEVPVVTRGTTIHIDFLLRRGDEANQTYLIAECKRTDSARARWGFAQAPYTWRDARPRNVIFEQVSCEPPDNRILERTPYECECPMNRRPYHHGFELRTSSRGEGTGQSTGAIMKAVTQALRGTSGWINHLFSHRSFTKKTTFRFIPVIFTTAELWVTDAELSQAELTTGTLPLGAVTAAQVDYVWLTHNRSSDLRHDLAWERTNDDLFREMRREFARSIAIVSPGSIESFLTKEGEGLIL